MSPARAPTAATPPPSVSHPLPPPLNHLPRHCVPPGAGSVTHSVVYNNGSLTAGFENTVMDVGRPGYAVFPAGQLHVTQNEGCTKAVVLSVFPVSTVDAYFFPYSEVRGRAGRDGSWWGARCCPPMGVPCQLPQSTPNSVVCRGLACTKAVHRAAYRTDSPQRGCRPHNRLTCTRRRPPPPQAYLPANTISSFFGGKADNALLWKPLGTAKLGEGSACSRLGLWGWGSAAGLGLLWWACRVRWAAAQAARRAVLE